VAGFDAIDVAMLEDTASRLALNGRDCVRISSRRLLDELLALQAIFGPHASRPEAHGQQEDVAVSVDSLLKQGLAAAQASDRGRWGELEHLVVPHNKPHIPARKVLRRKPGFMGPLRFPHRAVMGGDGQAFTQMYRAAAGTALIDCSGSMHLDEAAVRQLMSKLPAVEIGLYAGFPKNGRKGWLCAIARSGRLGELSLVSSHFGGCNVVDGPALRWLASKRGPRFWISDGAVNGCEGQQAKSLFLDVLHIVQQFKIQRLDSISSLLARW
jgi:hypothetical protein